MEIANRLFEQLANNAPFVASLFLGLVFLIYTFLKLKRISLDSYEVGIHEMQKRIDSLQEDNNNLRQSLEQISLAREALINQLTERHQEK